MGERVGSISESQKAIARLRSYVPPPTGWWSLPLARRAAVLLLLYIDSNDDLQAIVTIRSGKLRESPGHAALVGGKSDSWDETPIWTARREAYEEIGLPIPERPAENTSFKDGRRIPEVYQDIDDFPPTTDLPESIEIEHLTELPTNVSYTLIGVRPVVALLKTSAGAHQQARNGDMLKRLELRPNVGEVAAVFSVPLRDVLRAIPKTGSASEGAKPIRDWHISRQIHMSGVPYLWHAFQTRQEHDNVIQPQGITTPLEETIPKFDEWITTPTSNESTLRIPVFGMTARILIDCARIAYDTVPEFEHDPNIGDELLVAKTQELLRTGISQVTATWANSRLDSNDETRSNEQGHNSSKARI